MKKVKVSAAAQRAFEWYARQPDRQYQQQVSFRIHPGTGECVCTECERARQVLDQIMRAGR